MLSQITLLWSVMHIVLLLGLWARLKWEGGYAIRITDSSKSNGAKNNCIWASVIDMVGGIIAAVQIATQDHKC